MNLSKINKVGEINRMNNGQLAEIIEYENKNNITIKFEDGYIKNSNYGNFKTGAILE